MPEPRDPLLKVFHISKSPRTEQFKQKIFGGVPAGNPAEAEV
jgi:hypothetical protein